jgi:NitT/TauT family transport system permease protein
MRHRLVTVAWVLVVAATFLGAWKLYIVVDDTSPLVLRPPEDVWSAFVDLLGEERTWHHIRVTFTEIVGGFALAVVVGVLLGMVLGELPRVAKVMNPYVVVLQVLPKVALIPLFLAWLGFGIRTNITIAAVFAIFPMTTGTRAGIRSVDPAQLDLAATLQMSRWQRLWLIDTRSALPAILTGMEVAIVLATVGAVVSEFFAGGRDGLGHLAVVNLGSLRIDRMLAVDAMLCIIGVVLYVLVAGLRRWLVPWHASARRLASMP